MQNDIDEMKKMLIREMERYFGDDGQRIAHARDVLRYAEELLKAEKADPYIVIPAALLHDAGLKPARGESGPIDGRRAEKEGAEKAGRILVDMGYEEGNTYEICALIAHHRSPGPMENSNFKVVYDADALADLKERSERGERVGRRPAIGDIFLTSAGKLLARKVLSAR